MTTSLNAMLASDTIAATSQRSRGVADFIRSLFLLLEQYDIRYCVLHGWEGLPDELPSDLDLAVHPEDAKKLPIVVRALHQQGYLPIQMLQYAVKSYRYDFAWSDRSGLACAGLDITYEYREGGLILMSAPSLLEHRRRHRNFWIASATNELAYILAKKSCKGEVSLRQQQSLRHLVEQMGSVEVAKVAGSLFGKKYSAKVIEACNEGRLPRLLPALKRRLWWTILKRQPLNPARNLVGNLWRLLHRWFRPSGLLVVILGPDGVGKSTVIERLTEIIGPSFRGHRLFHWRPMLLHSRRGDGQPVTNPHGKAPRGTFASIAVCSVLLLDYWLGYFLTIRPLLARARVVLFDRYFHDILVDPIRYRYGGPKWLLERLSSLIPARDALFIILDAEEETILSRKREVPIAELRRQREAYRQLATKLNRTPVRTDEGVEQTTQRVSRQVVEYLAQQFQCRHLVWMSSDADQQARDAGSVERV